MAKFKGAPAAAYALPSVRKSEKKASSPAEEKKRQKSIGDLLGLGTGRRKVAKQGKNGLRPWGGEWTTDQVGGLFRHSTFFAEFILLSLASRVGSFKQKEPTSRQIREAVVEEIREPQKTAGMAREAERIISVVTEVANKAKMNPVDVAHLMLNAIGNAAAGEKRSSIWIAKAIASQQTSDNITAALTLREHANQFSKVGHGLFSMAARVLREFSGGKFHGFAGTTGLRPWKRGKGTPIAVEVVSVTFGMPRFDASGKKTGEVEATHTSAAMHVEQRSRDSNELHGALGKTPAGRIWLCVGDGQTGLFLGSDRKPGRKLFLAYEQSRIDAAIQDRGAASTLTGFVF